MNSLKDALLIVRTDGFTPTAVIIEANTAPPWDIDDVFLDSAKKICKESGLYYAKLLDPNEDVIDFQFLLAMGQIGTRVLKEANKTLGTWRG